MHQKMVTAFAVVFFWLQNVHAENPDVEITPAGFAYFQIGQVEKSDPRENVATDKAWDEHINARLTLSAVVQKQLEIIVGVEAQMGTSVSRKSPKFVRNIVIKEAQGIYSFGEPKESWLQIATGYFPFKYNPEAKNLGEYLFRSGAYPGYIITDFDFAKARLAGFNISCKLFGSLKQDLLFTSEFSIIPVNDFSLSYVLGYTLPNKVLDLGAGINFERLIPIDNSQTSNPANFGVDSNGNVVKYTLRGTKLMGRLSFDVKKLFPEGSLGFFGKDDGKLYGEGAILGYKNYYNFYDDITKRMPIMWGFNIPTLKLMDCFSFEWEWYGTKYRMNTPMSGSPRPDLTTEIPNLTNKKWSIFAQKTMVKGLAVKGLIGMDHYRFTDEGGNYDGIEHMNAKGDWHYNLRIMFSF